MPARESAHRHRWRHCRRVASRSNYRGIEFQLQIVAVAKAEIRTIAPVCRCPVGQLTVDCQPRATAVVRKSRRCRARPAPAKIPAVSQPLSDKTQRARNGVEVESRIVTAFTALGVAGIELGLQAAVAEIEQAAIAAFIVAADRRIAGAIDTVYGRTARDEMHHARQRFAAIDRRRRTTQHLDALDLVHVDATTGRRCCRGWWSGHSA